ncbi:MAG: amino acid ABC transporter permease [Rhodospirillaceae bacterium]|nr:amino acid ABC transporter permease [Rhodospirillaceae bacterium]
MSDYDLIFRTVVPYLGELPDAILTTLWLSLLTIALSFVIGILGALARRSGMAVLRLAAAAYVEFMRNTPLLVLLYLVYFGIPQTGLRVSGFVSAVVALTLNSGAYMTEILRGGLLAIPRGQYDAALSQGMTGLQTFRHVVFPQVFRIIYAPLGNQFIQIVLGSSLASVVAVDDITSWMQTTGSATFRYLETFVVAGLVYVAMCQLINAGRLVTGRLLFRRPS